MSVDSEDNLTLGLVGLTKPSPYAADGNKEQTFHTALDHNVSRYVQPGIDSLAREANAREAIRLAKAQADGQLLPGTGAGSLNMIYDTLISGSLIGPSKARHRNY